MQIPEYDSIYLFLTHRCNALCTFCYRKGQYKRTKIETKDMTIQVALDTMKFAFTSLKTSPKLTFKFWGGEAFLNLEVIKAVVSTYPQFLYSTNTNGLSVTPQVYDWLNDNPNFLVTWSLGNATEKYGSIKEKIAQEWLAYKLIKNNSRHSVNFMVVNHETFFDDYRYLVENVSRNVCVDIATKFDHKEEDLQKFADSYFKVMDYYRKDTEIFQKLNPAKYGSQYARAFGYQSLVQPFHFCRTGLDRILIDPEGGIWQCDNMYVCGHNKLGTIYSGIDYSKLDYLWEIDKEKKVLGTGCEECEIYGECPRNKCLGLNLEFQGDMFKPEPSWCSMCKVLHKVSKRYIEIALENKGVCYVK